MPDYEARHIIEAMRSGVPSRAVGRCFSEARPNLMRHIQEQLDRAEQGHSSGMIVRGRYGEGKTHLLNTVLSMAYERNMVVTMLPLSMESPMDKLHVLYPAIVSHTYLPGREQPGFLDRMRGLSVTAPQSLELQEFARDQLDCDKLYYLFRGYLKNLDNDEAEFMLRADLEGGFMSTAAVKRIYRSTFHEIAKTRVNFAKTQHTMDYLFFLSRFFRTMGYQGWVILFDEAELMGRLAKKARMNFYRNMASFLMPDSRLANTFSLFAFTDSYVSEVIEHKHDWRNLEELFPEDPEPMRSVMKHIEQSNQLVPLTRDEVRQVIRRIRDFHAAAYDWQPDESEDDLLRVADNSGYLLRTRLRAVIETLDQDYQYGSFQDISVGELQKETYAEEETPSLDALDQWGR